MSNSELTFEEKLSRCSPRVASQMIEPREISNSDWLNYHQNNRFLVAGCERTEMQNDVQIHTFVGLLDTMERVFTIWRDNGIDNE